MQRDRLAASILYYFCYLERWNDQRPVKTDVSGRVGKMCQVFTTLSYALGGSYLVVASLSKSEAYSTWYTLLQLYNSLRRSV